jgi:Flp pilus assembly protein TadG
MGEFSLKSVFRTIGNQRGVAAMEFALVAPILLLIVFATIEYGWYLTHWLVTNNAATEGARAAVKAREWESDTHAAEDPEEFARTALAEALWIRPELDSAYVETQILSADETGPRRIEVRVVDLPYRPLTGYLGKTMLPETLAAKAVMAFP